MFSHLLGTAHTWQLCIIMVAAAIPMLGLPFSSGSASANRALPALIQPPARLLLVCSSPADPSLASALCPLSR